MAWKIPLPLALKVPRGRLGLGIAEIVLRVLRGVRRRLTRTDCSYIDKFCEVGAILHRLLWLRVYAPSAGTDTLDFNTDVSSKLEEKWSFGDSGARLSLWFF